MRYKVKLLPIVYNDLREAKKWYKEKKETLAEDFKTEVNKKIDHIAEYPERYPRKYKELRQTLVRRFPYAIFYLIEEQKKRIVIFGILHVRRNPEVIQGRIKG